MMHSFCCEKRSVRKETRGRAASAHRVQRKRAPFISVRVLQRWAPLGIARIGMCASAARGAGDALTQLEISFMKTTMTLLIALGLASSAAVAQTQSSPGAGGVQSDSQAGQQSQYGIGPSGVQPGSPSTAPQPGAPADAGATSGASSGIPSSSGTLGPQSGAQSGMPPHPSSGTSGTQSGMPPASTDTSGAQPTMPVPPASGTSGTEPSPQSGMPPSTAPDTSGAAGATGTTGAQHDMPPLPGSAEEKAQRTSGASGMPSSTQGGAEPSPIAGLQPKTENGVTYICGGVGQEERTVMKREAKKHDVLLTFADKRGELMADVNVAIKDAKGNSVLETTCDGPMMLVDLPKGGKYRVHAEANGHAIEQTVAVTKAPGKKAQQTAALVLTWPDRIAELEGPAETATGGSATGGTGATGGGGKGNR
jgi:hypothetical protein